MTLLFSIVLSSLLLPVQDIVPAPVKAAFFDQYTEVPESSVIWGVQDESYVASFTDDRDQFNKVFFSGQGDWLQTQVRLYPSQLPRSVYHYYERNHFEKDVTFLALVQLPEGGEEYRVEWETYDAVYIERISPAGELLEVRSISFTEGLEAW